MEFEQKKVLSVRISFATEDKMVVFEGTPQDWNLLCQVFFRKEVPRDLPTILNVGAKHLRKG